jgi:hypothetical protein
MNAQRGPNSVVVNDQPKDNNTERQVDKILALCSTRKKDTSRKLNDKCYAHTVQHLGPMRLWWNLHGVLHSGQPPEGLLAKKT